MAASLLFLPDISGYTEFVSTTEIEHSQHVISELLEVLLKANSEHLTLAEVEGDALFFYKENDVLSLQRIINLSEGIFTAFHSHLNLLEKNRICPCNACLSAPKLQLKIIAHSGPLEFINLLGKKKPFGKEVIEAHRLMKNSIPSNQYLLLSETLINALGVSNLNVSGVFEFTKGKDTYDDKELKYSFAEVDVKKLKLLPFSTANKVTFKKPPNLTLEFNYPIDAHRFMEYISNYKYRNEWVDGVDRFEFAKNEVTRIGTEHTCIINNKHLNFTVVTKAVARNQLVYGELTKSIPFADEMYQFYIVENMNYDSCKVIVEIHIKAKSPLKRVITSFIVICRLQNTITEGMQRLLKFIEKKEIETN